MHVPIWWWVAFNVFVLAMLALDLGVFHRKAHAVKFKEAVGWSIAWITLALAFNVGVWHVLGAKSAADFLTGYVVEKSLSVDNIFVFLVIFTYFRVSPVFQHKVLFWGILGALVMRAVFIAAGVVLIAKFHWAIYVFGLFLVATGVKMALVHDKQIEPEKNPVLRLFRRVVPVTDDFRGGSFFVRQQGKLWATPLFVALLFIEISDVIFAVDSIPAILGITRDPFIVYTSNVFAILGLRALFFALAGFMTMFYYLNYGLSAILSFIGVKMLLADLYKIEVGTSLAVIASVLFVAVVMSVRREKKLASAAAAAAALALAAEQDSHAKAPLAERV